HASRLRGQHGQSETARRDQRCPGDDRRGLTGAAARTFSQLLRRSGTGGSRAGAQAAPPRPPAGRRPLPSATIGAMPAATVRRTRDLGILALAVIAPLWGYSWIVSKVALGYSGPFTFAGIISGLGALVLFVTLAATRRSLRPPPLRW